MKQALQRLSTKEIQMIRKVFSIMVLFLGCLSAQGQNGADLQQVFFRVGSAVLNADAVPQSMVDSAKAASARGEKYTVLGVASPEGSYKANERLATRRAKAIVKQISKRTGIPDSMFNVKTLVAGIDKLRDLARQDENLPDKERVLEILADDGSTGATLAKLKKLGDGTPYLYIKDHLFPYLRASITSEKNIEDFHPDLASNFQPQIIHHAVTPKEPSRHSSYNEGQVTPKKAPVVTPAETPVETPKPEKSSKLSDETKVESPEKSSGSSWLYWVVIILLILALIALSIYHKYKMVTMREQLKKAQNRLAEAEKNLDAQKNVKTDLYMDGESLYNHLMIGGVTYEWTNEQIRSLIEYYKLQNYPLIHSLETEYDNLPLNHILFEILVNMGKSDQEIQRMMNISQATIRSYRFRIKNKKL